ncbi:hypothetical protein LJY25_17305 [Hymenobacter sp. BT175]|uniref:hypothetical protein n=1 Tax=Hymenobacter translucens TaxID=2886507 RepID=UPI001D0E607A|nr:hypothetical protein [Hymenobacter translucens]MCC2548211.1 hypothetical protein [Hymenobacter translucens]
MNEDLQRSLAANAQQWLALSQTISTAEKVSFAKIHDGLFATYGSNFMSHVYRTAFEQMLQNTPHAERNKLLSAVQAAIDEAVEKHFYTVPTEAQCQACHSR